MRGETWELLARLSHNSIYGHASYQLKLDISECTGRKIVQRVRSCCFGLQNGSVLLKSEKDLCHHHRPSRGRNVDSWIRDRAMEKQRVEAHSVRARLLTFSDMSQFQPLPVTKRSSKKTRGSVLCRQRRRFFHGPEPIMRASSLVDVSELKSQ